MFCLHCLVVSLGEKKPSEEPYAGRSDDGKKKGDDEHDETLRQQELENFVQEELYIHGKARQIPLMNPLFTH